MNKGIEAAVAVDEGFLQWTAEFGPAEALEFAQHCQGYNNASNKRLTGLIQYVNDHAPKMKFAGTNANNGHPSHRFKIGREYSRVVYVVLDRQGMDPEFKWDKYLKGIERHAKTKAECDEFHVTEEDRRISIRIWWD
jgi:hypothetical protein